MDGRQLLEKAKALYPAPDDKIISARIVETDEGVCAKLVVQQQWGDYRPRITQYIYPSDLKEDS